MSRSSTTETGALAGRSGAGEVVRDDDLTLRVLDSQPSPHVQEFTPAAAAPSRTAASSGPCRLIELIGAAVQLRGHCRLDAIPALAVMSEIRRRAHPTLAAPADRSVSRHPAVQPPRLSSRLLRFATPSAAGSSAGSSYRSLMAAGKG